jgi:hypothetical protein
LLGGKALTFTVRLARRLLAHFLSQRAPRADLPPRDVGGRLTKSLPLEDFAVGSLRRRSHWWSAVPSKTNGKLWDAKLSLDARQLGHGIQRLGGWDGRLGESRLRVKV